MLFFSQIYYTVNCVDSSIFKNCAGFCYHQVHSFLNKICLTVKQNSSSNIKHILVYFSFDTPFTCFYSSDSGLILE